MSIKVKREMTLPIDYKNGKFHIYQGRVLSLVLGTSSVSGNLHLYGVTKIDGRNEWVVPIENVKRRIHEIRRRIKRDTDTVELMEEIVGQRG